MRDALQRELQQLYDKAHNLSKKERQRMQFLHKQLNLCICRNCHKEYDESTARGDWKGFCSAKCQHLKAKELGYRKNGGQSEYTVLNTAKCIGSDFVIK